jgi:hypothetical protein
MYKKTKETYLCINMNENEKRKMKNEKWKMKNEKWKMKNEKWKMKNEKWKMKNENENSPWLPFVDAVFHIFVQ